MTNVEHYVAELGQLLAHEEGEIQRLVVELERARTRAHRIRRAIGTLTGKTIAPRKPLPRGGDKRGWHISDAKVDQVWQIIRAHGEPFTGNGLAADTPGLSHESTRRAIAVLHERGWIRKAGDARGGGTLWLAVTEPGPPPDQPPGHS